MNVIITHKITFPMNEFHLHTGTISQDIQASIAEQSLFSRRPLSFIPIFRERLFKEKTLVLEGFELITTGTPLLFIITLNHPIHGKTDVSVKITPFHAIFESTMNEEDLRTIGYTLLRVYE